MKTEKKNKALRLMLTFMLTLLMVFVVACGDDDKEPDKEVNNNVQEGEDNKDDASNGQNGESDEQDEQDEHDENDDASGDTENEGGSETNGSEEGANDENGNNDENNGDSGNNGGSENDGNSDNGGGSSANDGTSSGNDGANGDSGSTDEDIIGDGTKDSPYAVIPDLETMSVTTVNIPAGSTIYYDIQRVGGMILVIENANAYVIDSEGNRYDAVNGIVTFEIESALASDFVSFQIGNKGNSAVSFTIKFQNKTGSYQNPTQVSSLLNNSFTIHLEEGNQVGHYYKYIAEKDGVIRFHIESITNGVDGGISITNNRNSANRTLGADGDGTYVDIEVQKGDELMIVISVLPDRRNKYKEADITWHGQYAE